MVIAIYKKIKWKIDSLTLEAKNSKEANVCFTYQTLNPYAIALMYKADYF